MSEFPSALAGLEMVVEEVSESEPEPDLNFEARSYLNKKINQDSGSKHT